MYIFIDNTTFYFTSERKKIMKLNSEFVFFFKETLGSRKLRPDFFDLYYLKGFFKLAFESLM